jgi:hypothetical protein
MYAIYRVGFIRFMQAERFFTVRYWKRLKIIMHDAELQMNQCMPKLAEFNEANDVNVTVK